MQNCKNCNHNFSYFDMLFTVRNIQCPICNTKYKIDARSVLLYFVLVVVGAYTMMHLIHRLPTNFGWLSYIIVIGALFALAPLNQKLKVNKADENS